MVLPLFLYTVVTIEFQSAVYSVSEGSGSVDIVVAKRGSTTSTIIVELSTTDVSASGKTVLSWGRFVYVEFRCKLFLCVANVYSNESLTLE